MKLNLKYYKGKDLYSDGDIEEDIIRYIEKYKNLDDVFEKDIRFPVLYHLSSIRSNILNWYPFKNGASILEIGAGMGAITPTLCDKAKRVVSVELSRQRARAIEKRCKSKKNLELIVGNFNDIEFNEKFDYITLIGVLEYAALYTNSDSPFESFLKNIKSLLKDDGILLIAIENQFGMKYFAGLPEDHTGIYFDGIQGYSKKNGIRTFGKETITKLLKSIGFSNVYFHYTLPDYKLPNVIFSDEFLPDIKNIERSIQYYSNFNAINFSEIKAYQEIIKENPSLFPHYSNSFFIQASIGDIDKNVKGVFYNNLRNKKYQLKTLIQNDFVTKLECSEDAKDHLSNMKKIIDIMNKEKLTSLDKYEEDKIVGTYLRDKNYEEKLNELYLLNGFETVSLEVQKFFRYLEQTLKRSNSKVTIFERYNIDVPKDLTNQMRFIENGLIDLKFNNCFKLDAKYYFHDQEWIENNIPIEFIYYRALLYFSVFTEEEKNNIYYILNITPYIKYFEELEEQIQKKVLNENVVKAYGTAQNIQDLYVHEIQEKNNLVQQYEELLNSKNQVVSEAMELAQSKNELVQQYEELLHSKNRAVNESNELAKSRDKIVEEYEKLYNKYKELEKTKKFD